MNNLLKWMILSANSASKSELERLKGEYLNIRDSDPRLRTPEAASLTAVLEAPPVEADILIYPDKKYPAKLRQLKNPPPALYVLGDTGVLSDGPCVAVVGSRDATVYGMTVTSDFCRDFREAGFIIVTGGAKGIDSVAAETAVKFGGKVILVLGCGVDVVYPPENADLFRQVIDCGGAIVSEFPFGTQPVSDHFPRRNRIIAALSDGCVVTEAGARSGAIITANYCLDLRRPLYAVPGNITSAASAGTNGLIRSGAIIATDGMITAAELKLALSFTETKPSANPVSAAELKPAEAPKVIDTPPRQPKKAANLTPDESKIVAAILNGHSSIAEISSETGLDEAALAPTLVMLELKGIIERQFGGRFTAK